MRHLDLCSGVGGFALAAGWAGYTTIGFCEIDPYCQRVLAKHWPGVPIHDDLTTLDAGTVQGWINSDQSSSNANGDGLDALNVPQGDEPRNGRATQCQPRSIDCIRPIALLTAGYPCQPFSQAGKRLGEADDRHLWPAIAALIADLQPHQCLFENVAGHITLGLDRVLADLETLGYACGTVVVPACAVNAPHRRDRVWVMAHAEGGGGAEQQGLAYRQTLVGAGTHAGRGTESWNSPQGIRIDGRVAAGGATDVAHATDGGARRGSAPGPSRLAAFGGEVVADVPSARLEGAFRDRPEGPGSGPTVNGRRETLGGLGLCPDGLPARMAQPLAFGPDWEDGIPRTTAHEDQRVAKLKALGNAIVPQVAYEIITAMKAAA